MTIPWREFIEFDERSMRAEDPDSHNYNQLSDWDPTQYPDRRRLGEKRFVAGTHYEMEIPLFRVKGGGQNMVGDGLEDIVNIDIDFTWAQETWTGPTTLSILSMLLIKTSAAGNTEDSTVNWDNFSGRWKDRNVLPWAGIVRGIAPIGPEYNISSLMTGFRITAADKYLDLTAVTYAYLTGTTFRDDDAPSLTNIYGGIRFRRHWGYGPPHYNTYALQSGDEVWGIVKIKRMKVRYFNPITNAISKMIWQASGGTAVVFTGSNYQMDNADLNAFSFPTFAWNMYVTEIDVIGLQGQGTTTLTLAGADFAIDGEGQITITSTPALTPGTYELLFRSTDHSGAINITTEQYAGDWRTDSLKRITPGDRFVIYVGDIIEDGYIIVFKWEWKNEDGDIITEHLAPIDIRAPDVFYHGRILSHTNFSREVNDWTGMYSVGDMTLEVANNDNHYSSLLANYFLKNQTISIYLARRNQPEAWKTSMIKMVVDDYEIQGTVFRVVCKDVTNKYFQVTIPRNIIEEDFYPNAHESVIGQPMPDVLGLNTLGGQTPGAVEARLIDTAAFKYIAAAGPLHSVPQVYSEGVLQAEGAGNDYTISYEDGGRTYINFNADQGEKKITFNCTGYTHEPWNSVNGYVQNPAYTILFVLAFLLEIPAAKIDLESFDTVAALMGTLEVHTAGRWIGQDGNSGETVIQELLQTYGSKLFVDKEGKLKLDRKDLTNYATDKFVFGQIHCIQPAKKTFGLNEAINVFKVKYDYYPTASLFLSVVEARNETSITNFEAEREPDSEFNLKWSNSPTLAQLRSVEELIKFSEGYKKAEFLLSFKMTDELDIMDSFRFQDPFGIVDGGGGEFGRYYYVISLQPNHMNMTLEVIAVDLTWLIEQESGSGSG